MKYLLLLVDSKNHLKKIFFWIYLLATVLQIAVAKEIDSNDSNNYNWELGSIFELLKYKDAIKIEKFVINSYLKKAGKLTELSVFMVNYSFIKKVEHFFFELVI